jgi:hypothetical protein
MLVVLLSMCYDVFNYMMLGQTDLKDFPLLPNVCGARQLLINRYADTIRDGHGYQPIYSLYYNLVN